MNFCPGKSEDTRGDWTHNLKIGSRSSVPFSIISTFTYGFFYAKKNNSKIQREIKKQNFSSGRIFIFMKNRPIIKTDYKINKK